MKECTNKEISEDKIKDRIEIFSLSNKQHIERKKFSDIRSILAHDPGIYGRMHGSVSQYELGMERMRSF